jgi:hypothetical protein
MQLSTRRKLLALSSSNRLALNGIFNWRVAGLSRAVPGT